MKYLLLLGCLSSLAVGGVTSPLALSQPTNDQSVLASLPVASSKTQRRDAFYRSDRFGFRFSSPQGYVITSAKNQPSTKPAKPLEVIEVWQQADFLNRASLPETPPLIRITVYNNAKRLPLTYWKGELSRKDDRPLIVAGQKAIAYSSTGLYENDNVLLSSPNGQYVFRLTVGYSNAKAPIRKTFQNIVSSFTFS